MALTAEQQQALDAVKEHNLVKISAVAGSGKSHTLVAIAKELQPKTGVYLAYNKAIAAEANVMYEDTNIKCLTIHSLAYKAVVHQYGLSVGYFNVRDVPVTANYAVKKRILNVLEDFLTSKYLDTDDYFNTITTTEFVQKTVDEILDGMSNGVLKATHSFYLKFYHILLMTDTIKAPEYDLLLLDEAGDITAITLDIFNKIKATKKVLVGDEFQNIYSFNKTINGFKALAAEGVSIPLTTSFRCSPAISNNVEKFGKEWLSTAFKFDGTVNENIDETVAYISRFNSGLLSRMFNLYENDKEFTTTRPINTILELPLAIAKANSMEPIEGYALKHLEKARVDHYNMFPDSSHSNFVKFLRDTFQEDSELVTACKTILVHGKDELKELQTYVNSCKNPTITCTTAHSSKGLGFGSVTIEDDLNQAVRKASLLLATERPKQPKQLQKYLEAEETMRLMYVAATRAKYELSNATGLSIVKMKGFL